MNWAVKINSFSSRGVFAYLREEEFLEKLRKYTHSMMEPLLGNLGRGEFFVEKTPSHALFIPEIVQMFPDCKIVHILRDARDVVASMLALNRLFKSSGWNKKGWPPESAKSAARMWVYHVETVRAASKNLPNNQFYELKYRDLKSSTEDELLKLSKFLSWDWDRDSILEAIQCNDSRLAKEAKSATGLSIDGELKMITGRSIDKVEGFARKAKVGSWKEELNMKQKVGVWMVARKTMNKVGYPWKYPFW